MARKSRFRAPVQEKPKLRVYSTGAYVRLSVLDGHQCDSDSIENQEALVRAYVESDPSLSLFSVYSDNGETGVDFERDDFERLLDDIRAGKVDCVIVKDLSRFGRNYIEAGEYLEKIFPFMGVRFIAVNDGYDSIDPAASDSLSMHLKNLVNDVYARDISQKICPVLQEKQERGEFIGNWAAYGYLKSAEDKHRLVVDEETAPVVRDIFQWRLIGMDYQEIAKRLTELGIPSPSRYRFEKGMVKSKRFAASVWTGQVIKNMVRSEVYLGHVVQGKTRKALWKGQKRTTQPREKWTVVKNTHEAIISEDVFRQVQEQICNRRRRQKNGTTQIFSGLVKCADCGWSLAYGVNSQNKNPYAHYHCSKYGQGLHQCSMHYIRYDVLYAYVLSRLQYWSVLAQQDGDKLLKRLLNASDKERNTARKRQTAELKKAEKRKAEVDTLFAKMYEDWSAGRITEYNFNMLSEKYQGEQRELNAKIERLHEAMEAAAQTAVDAEKWIGLMKQYVNPTELTAELLNTLIEKILVHEAVKSEDGSREQEVEIFYRFIGKIE